MAALCPRCGLQSPVRLGPGQPCADCAARDAWQQAGERLVITRGDIERHEAYAVAQAAASRARARRELLAVAVAGAAAVVAAGFAVFLHLRHPIGPLDALVSRLLLETRGIVIASAIAIVAGVVGLLRLRRGRRFRHVGWLAATILPLAAGVAGAFDGAFAFPGTVGLKHLRIPPRTATEAPSITEKIMAATVGVVAPDAHGDARGAAIGTGNVIATYGDEVYLVTCSHVAMPYASTSTFRRARDAWPVFVEFSDGRTAIGKVRWVAQPPLDVALVQARLPKPPAAVSIAPDSERLVSGTAVTFVPLPYRDGWLSHSGHVQLREAHHTPAGEYDLLFTDLPVQPGDSGSGLYDAEGRLVGINTWTRIGGIAPEGISLPSEAMRAIVDAIDHDRIDELDDAMPHARNP